MPDPICKTCGHIQFPIDFIVEKDHRTGEPESAYEVFACLVCDLGQCSPQDPCRVCLSEMDSAAEWLREGAA